MKHVQDFWSKKVSLKGSKFCLIVEIWIYENVAAEFWTLSETNLEHEDALAE